MEWLVPLAVIGSIVLGIMAGRDMERREWEKRLLNRALGPDEAKRLTDAVAAAKSRPAAGDAQLSEALDAIAIEVERIGEGQRFLTKLLAQRQTR